MLPPDFLDVNEHFRRYETICISNVTEFKGFLVLLGLSGI